MRRSVFWICCVIGLGVRLGGLPAWGTFDTEIYKAWAVRAAAGLADVYGPPDRDVLAAGAVRPTVFKWGPASYFVDYPAGTVIVLALAGKLYAALRPGGPNTPLFNAIVNLGPFLASIAIAALLRRSGQPPGVGEKRSLAFWLNPAVILTAPFLGYNDPMFAVFAVGAVLAMARGSLPLAAGLATAGALMKPQGVLLAPVVFGLLARQGHARVWLKSLAAGALVAVLMLAPWWTQGHLLSALDGLRRPFAQQSLAPLGLNVWWIAGWIVDRLASDGSTLARIWAIDDFARAAGFDPRLVARGTVAAAAGTVSMLAWKRRLTSDGAIALAAITMVHTYALVATSVHENHTFLAVALSPLLLGTIPRAAWLWLGTSSFLALSLFFAAGLGRRVTRLRTIIDLRFQAGFDPTLIVAAFHVVLVILLWITLFRVTRQARRVGLPPASTARRARGEAAGLQFRATRFARRNVLTP